jgi:flavin prenyltransferase
MKTILAITGASGALYASKFIDRMKQFDQNVSECAVIFSQNGENVWKYELESEPDFSAIKNVRQVHHSDIFDQTASGSASYHSMIIMPCSMGTLGRIASGTSSELITRAADVMLKEKRTLILVPREAPYNSIHLQNMLTLDRAGAYIIPASPFFYQKPGTMDELIDPFIERILEKAGLQSKPYRWKE